PPGSQRGTGHGEVSTCADTGAALFQQTGLVAVSFGAFFQLVFCTAIGTDGGAILGQVNEYAGMHAPERGLRAWAIQRQVTAFYSDDFVLGSSNGRNTAHVES